VESVEGVRTSGAPDAGWNFGQCSAILSLKESAMTQRTTIEPHKGDKRYVRRDKEGRFKEEVDVGRSLAADRRQHSSTPAKKGQGDRGDRQS
jgi:hypothetical protein